MEELENEISTQVEENTVSLASAQALADALAKIEVYTPTTWVDNSSPDIDAEHLNKPEQAIKRVTDALNSAVDVIKDLQSQVTKNAGDISTVNNNLSNKADKTSLSSYAQKSDLEKSGVYIGGIHIHSFANKSSATTKKFTPTNANSHIAGLLIVDQNNKTDVYSIGRLSGVQPLLKKSDADLPTISSGVLSVSLVAWGSIALVSFDEFTIS